MLIHSPCTPTPTLRVLLHTPLYTFLQSRNVPSTDAAQPPQLPTQTQPRPICRRQHNLMNILTDPITQPSHIPLNRLNKTPNIPLHLLGREPKLPHSHPYNSQTLTVLTSTNHTLNSRTHILNHRPRLSRRHQTPRPQNPSDTTLTQLGQRILLAQAALKLNTPILDGFKDRLFTHNAGAGRSGGFGGLRVRRTDDADAQVGFDWVRKAQAVAHHGAVFGRA